MESKSPGSAEGPQPLPQRRSPEAPAVPWRECSREPAPHEAHLGLAGIKVHKRDRATTGCQRVRQMRSALPLHCTRQFVGDKARQTRLAHATLPTHENHRMRKGLLNLAHNLCPRCRECLTRLEQSHSDELRLPLSPFLGTPRWNKRRAAKDQKRGCVSVAPPGTPPVAVASPNIPPTCPHGCGGKERAGQEAPFETRLAEPVQPLRKPQLFCGLRRDVTRALERQRGARERRVKFH